MGLFSRRQLGERQDAVAACAWPVGSVFVSVLSTNPAQLLGFGAWTRIGKGRAVVGVDEADSDFDAAEKTGGAKTHTLSINEMPSHTHTQNAHSHVQNLPSAQTGGQASGTRDTSTNGSVADALSTANATATNQNTGGGAAHNNLQPFISLYLWKRTA